MDAIAGHLFLQSLCLTLSTQPMHASCCKVDGQRKIGSLYSHSGVATFLAHSFPMTGIIYTGEEMGQVGYVCFSVNFSDTHLQIRKSTVLAAGIEVF